MKNRLKKFINYDSFNLCQLINDFNHVFIFFIPDSSGAASQIIHKYQQILWKQNI